MKINIACAVTWLRILLTPVVVALMVQNSWRSALIIFLVAVLTDVVDGFLARRLNQQSKFGQLLDPVADKILLSTVMYTMLIIISASSWFAWAMIFLLCKEFVLLFGGGFLWFKFKMFIAPTVLSRAVSLCEVIFVLFVFMSKAFMVHVSEILLVAIMGVNVVLSVWLLLRYAVIVYNFSRRA